MKKRILRFVSIFLGLLLSGCDRGSDNAPAPEYGTPRAEYEIDGRVTDSAGNPIENIQVTFVDADVREYTTVHSNAEGEWSIYTEEFPCGVNCQLEVADVDGEENGSFESKTVTLRLQHTDSGSGSWDEGTYEQHGIEIVLDESDDAS